MSGDGTLQLFTFTQAAIHLWLNLSALPEHVISMTISFKSGKREVSMKKGPSCKFGLQYVNH